jgi:acetyltransferase-like isoleucine patch superfamily enzyme
MITTMFGLMAKFLNHMEWQMRYASYRKKYKIDKGFDFVGRNTYLYGDGQIICAGNSYINQGGIVYAHPGQVFRIGKNTKIGPYFFAHTFSETFDKKEVAGDIIIGDNVWIGVHVFVKQGVTIGDNSVVGANSAVVDDVPPNSFAAGNPAKIIKTIPAKGPG